MAANVGPSIAAGDTVLQRMPLLPKAVAIERVRLFRPALAAEYALSPRSPPREELDETFTIDPLPWATISGNTCLHTSMVPDRSTARVRFQSSRSTSTTVVSRA